MEFGAEFIIPALGARCNRRRVARGIGSGLGKTAGRGHKGQKSRAGGFHKVGFEGGQMPIYRRLPKRGFVHPQMVVELRLSALEKLIDSVVSLRALQNQGLVGKSSKAVKLIGDAGVKRAFTVQGVAASMGARRAIEAVGGTFI